MDIGFVLLKFIHLQHVLIYYVHEISVCINLPSVQQIRMANISLDEFDFSSMGSSVMLVSEFDHEAYGLSFKPFFLAI